jgi:hypothetical protein
MADAFLAFSSPNLFEAELVLSALRHRGVKATLRAPTLAIPEVWVEARDRERAAEVLAAIAQPGDASPAGNPARCASCGEESPAGFDRCWSCEAPFPSPSTSP